MKPSSTDGANARALPEDDVWSAFFARHDDDLSEHRWSLVARALTEALSSAGAVGLPSLKRYCRAALRGQGGRVDPWRLEVVVRAAGVDVPGLPMAALLRSTVPARGVDEPAPELRALALARALIERASLDESADLDPKGTAVGGVKGAAVVWWWLTGRRAPSPGPTEVSHLAHLAGASVELLARLGLLCAPALAARTRAIEEWMDRAREAEARDLGGDRIRHEFAAAWTDRNVVLATAREACASALRGAAGGAGAEALATELFSALPSEVAASPSRASALAGWCAEAWAVGLVGALGLSDHRAEGYRVRNATRLARDLGELLRTQPLSLLDGRESAIFWSSFGILLRDRLDAGDEGDVLALLGPAAEEGAWTRGTAPHVARTVTLLSTTSPFGDARPKEWARAFVTRLAVTAMRRRKLSAAKMWSQGMANGVDGMGGLDAADYLRRWWEPRAAPPAESISARDAVEWTRNAAGPEIALASVDDPAFVASATAWWRQREQAALSEEGKPLGAPLTRVSAVLAQSALGPPRDAPVAPSILAKGRRRTSLDIRQLQGRNGEAYVLVRLFGVSAGGVSALLEDDVYGRPVDQAEEMAELRRCMQEVRANAACGALCLADLDAVRSALAALAPRRVWSELAGHADAPGTAIELSVEAPDVPWEITPLARAGEPPAPLASLAPTFRRRALGHGAPARSPAPRATLLALADTSQRGVDAELAAIERAWSGGGRRMRVVETLAAFRQIAAHEAFDVVHYAGHQGPAHDATPSLALRDGQLRLRELVDRLHDRPPELVFLNACSTLAPSEALPIAPDVAETHLVFGALEPLLRSSIRSLVGTLWDVSPPADNALVRAFYEALAASLEPAEAMHRARLAVARDDRWALWWPAYVILTP